MKHISNYFSSGWLARRLAPTLTGLALLASAGTAEAANPTLRIQALGSPSGNPDVTAFVDQVEIVRVSDGAVMTGAVANPGFETNSLGPGGAANNLTGAFWTFNNRAGISRNNSGFGSTAPQGDAVGFLQTEGGFTARAEQTLALADGVYQVRFLTANRTNCCGGTLDQRLDVLVNGVLVGRIQPPSSTTFTTFISSTFVVSTPNNALAFDGTNDQVNVPNSASLSNIPTALTAEAWFRTSVTGERYIMTKGDDAFYLAMNGGGGPAGVVSWYVNGPSNTSGGWLYGTTNLADGRWHHVAGTYDGATLNLYVDGALQNSRAATGSIPTGGTHTLDIGARSNFAFWNGSLDEVRVYNAALNAGQVQADMFSTTPALPGNQVAYYNFDQGTAGGNNAGITTLTDQSGTGNTGTLTNFALTGTSSNWVRSFPTITGISPTAGPVGTSVTLTGTNLTDATGLAFNGTPVASFGTPVSDLTTTVSVPTGATTGPVSVASATLTRYNGPTFTVVSAVTWTGATSTDWATASNWSPAVVPTSSIDATIPAAPANQPLVSGTQVAKNVTVQTGARLTLAATTAPTTQLTLGSAGNGSLTLATGSTLTQGAASEIYITGNMTNNGATFALNATSEIGFGITTTNHVLNGTAGVTFQTLTVGEQGSGDNLNLQVPVQVRRKLGVYNFSTTSLGTGGSLTLLSDATGTALVENGTGSTVGGNVTVQRYIDPSLNPGAGYRHYSAPVANTTVADLTTAGFTPQLSASATYNASATPGTVTPFPNVFSYDQSRVSLTNSYTPFDRGFLAATATTNPLVVGQGYAVNIAADQLVDFVGTLNNGTVTRTLTRNAAGSANEAQAGWQLVGNPYPAPIDYSLVAPAATNLDAAMYVFESSAQYAGTYRAYVNGLPAANRYVASGQGFFVRVSSGRTSGTLSFQNSQRVTDPTTQVPFRRSKADARPLVQLELRGATGAADALYAYAETGATPAFDAQFDAVKLPNSSGLNLSSTATSGESLAIDGRPVFTAATVLPLSVGVPAAGTYSFTAAALNNLAGLDALLTDAATGQSVNLRQQPSYSFSVTAAQATALLTGRFTLRFAASSPLATAPALTAAEVSVFPNPARDQFSVLVPAVAGATRVQGTLLNALGQAVRTQAAPATAAGARLGFQTSGLAAGVYTLRLQVGNVTLAKRVVIQ